jgi:hypothetical protein
MPSRSLTRLSTLARHIAPHPIRAGLPAARYPLRQHIRHGLTTLSNGNGEIHRQSISTKIPSQ